MCSTQKAMTFKVDESATGKGHIINDPPSAATFQGCSDEAVEKALAEQLNMVSLTEREDSLFDIHGVSVIPEETPDVLEKSFQDLNSLLTRKIDWRVASAFRAAELQSVAYTRDRKFLLMFLRRDKYNTEAAASRIFTFFQHKLRLFGLEKLCKDITQSDLDPEDMKVLSSGSFQLLPTRDHIGRAQYIYLPRFARYEKHEYALRQIYYLVMSVLADDETQKKGAVNIVHCLGDADAHHMLRDPILGWKAMQLMRGALPMNFVGHHVCTEPGSLWRSFYSSILRFIGLDGILRTRFHEGSAEEIEEQLGAFGIQNIHFAFSHSCELKTEKHKEMLKMLKTRESSKMKPEEFVILPCHTDILLGRGKPIQNHPGNIRLGLIVESLLENYDESSKRQEKTKMAADTVVRMKAAGVRFLTRENGLWVTAPDKVARERVSSTFRTVRDRLKTNEVTKKPASTESSDDEGRKRSRQEEELGVE